MSTEKLLKEESIKLGKFVGGNYDFDYIKTLYGKLIIDNIDEDIHSVWIRDTRGNVLEAILLLNDMRVKHIIVNKENELTETEYNSPDEFISEASTWKFYGKEL